MANGYDRYMVTLDAAANLKTKRLKRAGKEVRWAWFHGVLPIAAKADMRGAFRVGDQAASEQDVADVADCTRGEARKALQVARALGMLEQDESGVEWVHDFEEYNPEPKKDSTSAKRSAEYRARMRGKVDAGRDVTESSRRDGRDRHAAVTPPEVEGEEEVETELRSVQARKRALVDQTALPDEFPEHLVGMVDVALAKLTELWQQRGGNTPTRRGVALAVRRFPDRDMAAVLAELEHWSIAGRGARKPITDWAKTLSTFLGNTNPGRPAHLRPIEGGAGDFSKYDIGLTGDQHHA